MKNKNNILVIGGTGFIGYHLSKKAISKGWEVTSISTRKPKKIRRVPKVKYLISDITKKKMIKKKINKYFRFVVNLGGYVDHSNRIKTYKSHYIGCKNVTDILLKKPPLAFVHMGSSGEYGKIRSPHIETDKCYPVSVYAKAKFLATKHLTKLYEQKKFPVTILRLYQSYGPRQDFNRFIPIIIKGCLKNKKIPCSDGNQLRDFVYVDDVVDAIFSSLIKKNAKGQVINIGSGKPKKIKTVIEYIKKTTKGGHPLFGEIELRKDEILKYYPNIKKAKKIINWSPKVSFRRGLKKTINFYEKRIN